MEQSITTIQLPEQNSIFDSFCLSSSKQSANTLFNCMKELEYLKSVLTNEAIIPRYYPENLSYLNIKNVSNIAFPMKCFCDIYLNKLADHMRFYGYYGIGMSKDWGIQHGIQPIHYINPKSNLSQDYATIFGRAFNMEKAEEIELYSDYNDYLLGNLLYMKPIDGEMFRDNKYELKNFHDEKEWRFVPDIKKASTELPLIIPLSQMNSKSYNMYSEGIKQNSNLWLKIEYKQIKYLIVHNSSDRSELIEFILKELTINEPDKFLLISKILVFDELQEDW